MRFISYRQSARNFYKLFLSSTVNANATFWFLETDFQVAHIWSLASVSTITAVWIHVSGNTCPNESICTIDMYQNLEPLTKETNWQLQLNKINNLCVKSLADLTYSRRQTDSFPTNSNTFVGWEQSTSNHTELKKTGKKIARVSERQISHTVIV